MPPFVHLAIAQFRPRKADYRGNLARLGTLFAEIDALAPRPAVLCLPESALTGYFLEGGVRDQAVTAGTLAHDLDVTYPRARSTSRSGSTRSGATRCTTRPCT
jgi:predicted amidohydrolase